ncbi:MAG: WYL domain-containing protein [Lachnospiraceae bacterium]|nr:WYL domain-containing protein [Lachnospiraceae bacterium]
MISQKATILCVYEILKKYSDENHIISAEKIREKLKVIYDVDMERRAVYRNIDALRSMGIDIEGYTDNREGYYLIDRAFEPSEIRLLCDAVAASDMIKEESSKEIINKLIDTQSVFQGRMLQKTVYVKNKQRIPNKQLFYNIDTLNIAISQGCKVAARLLQYNMDIELVEQSDDPVVMSPYATMWASGNYYILAKPEDEEELTHYRIDYLKDIVILERNVDMIFGGINPNQYAERFIFQNGEDVERYDIECNINLWQTLVEAFGCNMTVIKSENDKILVKIKCISSTMREWVMAHCTQCEVIAPKHFRDEIQRAVMEAYKIYWG